MGGWRGGCLGRLCGWFDDGRRRLPPCAAATGPGREKAPPTRGRRGLRLFFMDAVWFLHLVALKGS